eukprot:Gregarina_sp_Pseudo_9__1568@NODE_2052_length_1180_cov_19_175285_g1895_i0_p1_GENE_NODE_2052_length_1180_cov_19_175285_g1895_i0NODE_2052_length_1180_cov_19_175285_g1895_i0_p1_ORF_typecomplete_len385_score75_38Med31/PF05669_12/0_096GpFAR1/PF05823_12/0_2GpFAR1/PF05823_12/5_7e02Fzo_mitofusin/PF04799_13/6_2e02Fzo_mitofusin/PF04799_13/0_44Fzo_mitofusin/PF04799_13/1_2e03_NODE_2052_length_1180_cov_19_175285_g1895_i0251149
MQMDLINDLNELIKDLNEDQYLATSESPATAEEKICVYEKLLQSWRRMLYSQVGVLKILHVLESHESFATLVDEQRIEEDAQKTLQFLTQEPNSENNPISRQALLLESENLGDQTQQKWKEMEAKRDALLREAQELLNQHSRNSILAGSTDENVTSTEIREQRDRIQKSLETSQAALVDIHKSEITKRMVEIDNEITHLRELNKEHKEWQFKTDELEKTLYEEFGILAKESNGSKSLAENVETWLQEEVDFVASVLQSEVNALALIFTCEVDKDADWWTLNIQPKRGWPAKVLLGLPGAVFKGLSVKFAVDSMMPMDIKLKADLSSIPNEKAAKAQADLAALVDKWRSECYASSQMDIHGIIRIFILHAWSLLR